MYLTALALFLVVATSPAQSQEDSPREGYHKLVGIPAAKAIKDREDRIHSKETDRGEKIPNYDLENYPFYGGLIIHLASEYYSNCGSSLLNLNRLVTAAHCWGDGHSVAESMTVVLGSLFLYYGGERHYTKHVVVHPLFDIRTLENDIAMIYLPNKVAFTNTIFPIALPEGSEMTDTFTSQYATTVGIGFTEIPNEDDIYGPTLRKVGLQIISNEDCVSDHFGAPTPDMICTSGRWGIGPCYGDSGGPLYTYTDRKLVGIVSHGSLECGVGEPNVYTRVTSFISFIESHAILPKFTFHIEQLNGLLLENITVFISDDESGDVLEFSHLHLQPIKSKR